MAIEKQHNSGFFMVKPQKNHEKHSTKITVQSQISSWVKPWNHPPDTYQYCKRFRVIQRITYVPSSKHGIWAMVIHPILGIITMGVLDPIDGCMTIPLYEKTNHVLTGCMRSRCPQSPVPGSGGGCRRLKLQETQCISCHGPADIMTE